MGNVNGMFNIDFKVLFFSVEKRLIEIGNANQTKKKTVA